MIDKGERTPYLIKRRGYHEATLRAAHPEIPEEALRNWAEFKAEQDWRTDRVYEDPVQIEQESIRVHGREAKVAGANLRFGPAGPMVSIISLSHAELRELALEAIDYLRARGELAGTMAGQKMTAFTEPSRLKARPDGHD
jgi:hypothetical protein